MKSSRARLLLAALIIAIATPAPVSAYKRIKVGPFEFVPSLSVGVRQHSNVYLTNEDQIDNANQSTEDEVNPTFNFSGLIIDIRPGATITVRPNLEKRIRGLYVDVSYTPALSFFPDAPIICGDPPLQPCAGNKTNRPDLYKVDHNLAGNLRYQASGRLSFSAGVEYTEPQLSQADISIKDFVVRAGTKYDFSKTISLEGAFTYNQFETPGERVLSDNSLEVNPTFFGTFDDYQWSADLTWQISRTAEFGMHYTRSDRTFEGFPRIFNDFNQDLILDNRKDFNSQYAGGSLTKRLTRHTRGTITGGYIWRETEERQFGADTYNQFTGSATVETLITQRTLLQLSGEYALTDTIRRVSLPNLNAFTNDQIGQFSVLPEQFSAAESTRVVVDLIQNIFKRGDQLIFGVAWQHDNLTDQIGTRNFFVPGSPVRRDLNADICQSVDPEATDGSGSLFCETILDDGEQDLLLLTAGYRLRLLRWLGLQIRGAWFDGESTAVSKIPGVPNESVKTTYWNLSAGLVVNLQVFN